MIAGTPILDLDDAASLEDADSGATLRSAASGGAQVRATAAAVDEEVLARLHGLAPRSVVLVSGTGRAERAAALLVAALGERAGLPIVATPAIPQWVGPLDVVLVAGDDAGDPRLIGAVDRALKRSAEVVVATPDEGPLQAAAAGRAALLPPRVPVLDHNRLLRFVAVGAAVLRTVDPGRIGPLVPDLNALADLLDAEALRDGPHNEVFHNPAKTLASRMQDRRVVLAGDSPAATQVAAHAADVLLASAGRIATATPLADAVAAHARLVESAGAAAPEFDPLFHDEQLDGPAPVDRARVFVVSSDTDQVAATRRLAVFGANPGLVDADLVSVDAELANAEDAGAAQPPTADPDAASPMPLPAGGTLEQLAVVTVRLEMAAAYLHLIESPTADDRPPGYDRGRS